MAAPGGTGPIGPFPRRVEGEQAQDDYDKMRRRPPTDGRADGQPVK